MRTRYIKFALYENEELAALPMAARYMFPALWTLADRDGRLEDRPARLAAKIFPYDRDLDVPALLDHLEQADFIRRYEAPDGTPLIWIPSFRSHQNPHFKEQESTLAAHPDDEFVSGNGKSPGRTAAGRGEAEASRVGNGEWGMGNGEWGRDYSVTAPSAGHADAARSGFKFPMHRDREWEAPLALVETLAATYDSTIEAIGPELKKAAAWLLTNPLRRKTPRGMPRFLNSWLERQQNRRGLSPYAAPAIAMPQRQPAFPPSAKALEVAELEAEAEQARRNRAAMARKHREDEELAALIEQKGQAILRARREAEEAKK